MVIEVPIVPNPDEEPENEADKEPEAVEKRENQRFSDTTLIYAPMELTSLTPVPGKSLVGNLMNLSKGGMAILINKPFPMGATFNLDLTFPDRSNIRSTVEVTRLEEKDKRFIVGLKFLDLADFNARKIEKMTQDYLNCEDRIAAKKEKVCFIDCGFYSICKKEQKRESEQFADTVLRAQFESVDR